MFDFADLPTTYRWATALWLAALGGCIGSFLNVVVYRLPAGKSLVHPGSHCPKCGHAIRWYDNVPVLGWFALQGKCRDCGLPISFRYPLVEAVTAGLFFGLAWVELLSGGANLPLVQGKHQILEPITCAGELAGVYAFHLLLLCTLLPAALIAYDRQRIPSMLFAPALLVGVVVPVVFPSLHPGYSITGIRPLFWLYIMLIHIVAGLAIGWLLGWIAPRRGQERDSTGILLVTVCVGLFLNAETILLVGAAVFLVTILERVALWIWPRLPVAGPVIWLALLTPVSIAFWRPLAAMCPLVP